MIVGSIKEDLSLEKRVSITPETAKNIINLGLKICIENEYATHLGIKDSEYKDIGVEIKNSSNEIFNISKLLLKVNCPSIEEISNLKDKTILIGMLNPSKNQSKFKEILKKDVNIFSLELLPRITRAQSMDVLSSQSNLAGYRSVVDSIYEFEKAIPMMMTAAGTVPAAKVLVIGAGVAGLQAIATAKRLGAVVSATDVRSATKEQVESLGAKFIMVEDEESKQSETSGGYAKEMSKEYKEKQALLIAETISKQDIIICTALIPGKKAPILVTEKMVESMANGSIIVDLAVESGGNCPLSKIGEIVNHKGVQILGYTNVPGRVAKDASSLYAKNIINFLNILINQDEKKIKIDWNDEIINSVILSHEGDIKLENFK